MRTADLPCAVQARFPVWIMFNNFANFIPYNKETNFVCFDIKQDACRGVHSACRREVNRHKLDICILRLRQGRIPGIFVCRSKFPGLKVGRGSWLANMALKSSTWSRKSFSHRQCHGFSACVDAGYDIKKASRIFNKQCNKHSMNTFTISKTCWH